uniref:Uncharacterized protein n=1 Tax=Anguilla anguilla TaxID=7936 RepID=A0A0E9SNC4_ANGAN
MCHHRVCRRKPLSLELWVYTLTGDEEPSPLVRGAQASVFMQYFSEVDLHLYHCE